MKRYIIYGLSLIMFSAAPAFAQDEADEDDSIDEKKYNEYMDDYEDLYES